MASATSDTFDTDNSDVSSPPSESEEDSFEQDDKFKEIIGLVNGLRRVVSKIEKADGKKTFDLPQIVVCGDQSAGKTSVLESISGEEFLPRGTDIQTRYPIVVQLMNEKGSQKWVEFEHLPGERFEDMEDVKEVLERRNENIIKNKKVVSSTPTTLTLHSSKVPDLTLVDLPGLVENVVKGQPSNLAIKIEELVRDYIRNKNSIILAVTAATTDIAASKSIRIAKEVDPKRERTLGVITKLDLMDKGTTALEVLTGRKISLRLGIIGVINRSFQDTEQGKSFGSVQQKEKAFLLRHYRSIASQNGTPYLTKTICRLLKESINNNLPAIRKTLIPKIEDLLDQLNESGEAPGDVNKQATLRRLLANFCQSYVAQVDGRKRNINVDTLHAHVRINNIFDKIFKEKLEALMQVHGLKKSQIINAILNAAALHSTRIDYDDAFQELAKREIMKMQPVIKSCNQDVKKVLIDAIESSSDAKDRDMYPRLFDAISALAKKFITEKSKTSEIYLDDYIAAEHAITRSKAFELFQAKVKKQFGNAEDTLDYADEFDAEDMDEEYPTSETESTFSDVANANILDSSKNLGPYVRREVDKCLKKVKGGILEHVPKGIVNKLVYGVSDNILDYMFAELYKPDNPTFTDNLMHPVDRQAEKRKENQRKLELLENALTHIDNILLGKT